MPCVLVDDADFVAAGRAGEDVALFAAYVYLAGVAGAAPTEISCSRSVS